jgi:hypothetical protein
VPSPFLASETRCEDKYFEYVLGGIFLESGNIPQDGLWVFAASFDVETQLTFSYFFLAARTDVLGLFLEVHQYLMLP